MALLPPEDHTPAFIAALFAATAEAEVDEDVRRAGGLAAFMAAAETAEGVQTAGGLRMRIDSGEQSVFSQLAQGETDEDYAELLRESTQVERPLPAVRGRVAVAKFDHVARRSPHRDGFTPVLIHVSPKSPGGALSPFNLRDEFGHILENVWQFSKLYHDVKRQSLPLRRAGLLLWEHPAEVHADADGMPNAAYWKWRRLGMRNKYAVRYPNGYAGRRDCICAVWSRDAAANPEGPLADAECLGYVQARKRIYCALYARLAVIHDEFKALLSLLAGGRDLLLVEVDGPAPGRAKSGPLAIVTAEQPWLDICDEETVRYLLHDTSAAFGHGYVLATLLHCEGNSSWLR